MPIQRLEKPLHWVSSAKKELLALPAQVIDDFGYALGAVQLGKTPPQAKHWKGEGGIRTAQTDIALIHERLKVAQQHYKDHYEN